MDIKCSAAELYVLDKIAFATKMLGLESYLIGGFVRDKILGRMTKDMDIVCLGNGISLAEKVAGQFKNVLHVNIFKTYGTAQIRIRLRDEFPAIESTASESDLTDIPDVLEIEFVGARKESYSIDSRNPSVSTGTLTDDQNRRDFTINALAVSLNSESYGRILDPFNGLRDLNDGVLKTPLVPEDTFSDDPLRMMRAIRFAAQLNFTIDSVALLAISANAKRIRIVSMERISEEINKILLTLRPSVGFGLLFETGLLDIIFPQFTALKGAEYIDGHGHKDNFQHTLRVIDNISEHTNDLWLRWAAVLHDIAKPATKKFEKGHGWTFHGHEVVGGKMVPRIFTQLKLPQNEKMRFVRKMVEMHLRPISLTKENITDAAIRRLIFDAGEDLEALMMLCRADITSKNRQKVKRYLDNFELVEQRCAEVDAKDHIRNWQPPISGEMIMDYFNLPPGRIVGDIKNAIREAILDGRVPNNFDAARKFMVERAADMGISPAITSG